MDANSKKSKKNHPQVILKWSDKVIDKLQETHRELTGRHTIPFDTSGHLKGMHLRYNAKTRSKTFVVLGKLKDKGKTFTHTCGQFQLGSTGTPEISQYMTELVTKHKDRNGQWLTNPNAENVTKKLIEEDQKKTIRECIIEVAKQGFPRIKLDGSIDPKSQQQYSQNLFGKNKRRGYLSFKEDEHGCGYIELKDGMTYDLLFKKFPPYKHCDSKTDRSLYDSQLGALEISQLTPKITQNWCNSGKTYGARLNRLKAIQYLYRASNKLNLLSNEDILDPTRVNYGGVQLTNTKKKVSNNHRYNNMKFNKDQLGRLLDGAMTLRDDYPFSAEAVMFMLYSSRRQEETLKIDTDMLYKHFDQPDPEVITLSENITKSRTQEIVVITDGIKKVLDSLEYQRNKPKFRKYKFIKWLFPKANLNPLKCGDVEFCKSHSARYKNIEAFWKALKKLTGIDGQKKLFRKSLSTIGTKKFGADRTIQMTGHKDVRTLNKYYNKPDIDDVKETAQEFAKVYDFKK